MKVILLQEVKGLGKAGDIKEVRNGYGLNFLLPEGLAELATPSAVKQAERFIAKRSKELESIIADLKTRAMAIEGRTVAVKAKAEDGKLFGSVGREEIATALSVMNIDIDTKAIVIGKPFRETGVFAATADFGHGVQASFEVSVEAA